MLDEIINEYYRMESAYLDWERDKTNISLFQVEPTADRVIKDDPAPPRVGMLKITVDKFETLVRTTGHIWYDDGVWRCMFWKIKIVPTHKWRGPERGWEWVSE
jgi:hypothetical protein